MPKTDQPTDLQKRAATRDAGAQYALGLTYAEGKGGFKKDTHRATHWMLLATIEGNINARRWLQRHSKIAEQPAYSKEFIAATKQLASTIAAPTELIQQGKSTPDLFQSSEAKAPTNP